MILDRSARTYHTVVRVYARFTRNWGGGRLASASRDFLLILGVVSATPLAGTGSTASSAGLLLPAVSDGRFLHESSVQTAPGHFPGGSFVNLTSGEKSGRVEIRIRNNSDLDFDRVRVHFPDQREVDYGVVPKGGVSAFRTVDHAYRYAGFSVNAGNRELSLQPIDYLGEEELAAGRYTYAIGVDNGRLTVKLEKLE